MSPAPRLNLVIDRLQLTGIDPADAAAIASELRTALTQALTHALGDDPAGAGVDALLPAVIHDEVRLRELLTDVIRRVAAGHLPGAGRTAP